MFTKSYVSVWGLQRVIPTRKRSSWSEIYGLRIWRATTTAHAEAAAYVADLADWLQLMSTWRIRSWMDAFRTTSSFQISKFGTTDVTNRFLVFASSVIHPYKTFPIWNWCKKWTLARIASPSTYMFIFWSAGVMEQNLMGSTSRITFRGASYKYRLFYMKLTSHLVDSQKEKKKSSSWKQNWGRIKNMTTALMMFLLWNLATTAVINWLILMYHTETSMQQN